MSATEKPWENISMTLADEDAPEEIYSYLEDAQHLVSPNYDKQSIRNIIKNALENHNKIEKIKRRKTRSRTYTYTFDNDFIKMLYHLSQVSLTQLANNETTKAITRLVGCCVHLQELRLYGNPGAPVVRNPVLVAHCGKLSAHLRVLHVDCVKWSWNAVNAIRNCHLLEDLAIREAKDLYGEGLLLITQMPTLRRLHVDNCCKPEATNWIALFSNNNLKELTYLHLENCSFNDHVAVTIGTNLKNLTNLTMFTRMTCLPSAKRYVANRGLDAIIKGCSQLIALELSFGGWGDRQLAKTLLLIPEHLPRLERLSAIPLFTSIKWKTILLKQMPTLLIRDSFLEELQ